jgi:hypothetical protein
MTNENHIINDLISLYVIVDDDVYEHGYEYSICLLEIDNNESIISIVSTTLIDINDSFLSCKSNRQCNSTISIFIHVIIYYYNNDIESSIIWISSSSTSLSMIAYHNQYYY